MLKVTRNRGKDMLLQKPMIHVEDVVILGGATLTTPLAKHCAREGVGVHYLSQHGQYYARLERTSHTNVPARVAQFRTHLDPAACLALAKQFVLGKLRNSLVFLRRNGGSRWHAIKQLLDMVEQAADLDALRGMEGQAADIYFTDLATLLPDGFAFTERSKRPPRDPTNSLLSLAYTLLSKEAHSAIEIAGLDPYVGYLHAVHCGRPSLALDLMEEFRSIVADSVVLGLINNRRITPEDFDSAEGFPRLRKEAWPQFLRAWELRLNERVRHPRLGRSYPYREVLLCQARILTKSLLGEIESYVPFTVR
jgi:CRISPR-associated protein Cas1